jgi:hypothetical protein
LDSVTAQWSSTANAQPCTSTTVATNIAPGEEITYDYCLYDGDDGEALCNCGAAKCRGTMYSKEEVRRRKAAAKRAVKKQTK